MARWGAIAFLIGSCQPKSIDHGAEAVAWYEDFQQSEGMESACLQTEPDPPAIEGDFQLKSTRLEPMEIGERLTAFRQENILTDGATDIYVYGWKTEEFATFERSIYEMVGQEPPSLDEMSQLDRCFVFSLEAL